MSDVNIKKKMWMACGLAVIGIGAVCIAIYFGKGKSPEAVDILEEPVIVAQVEPEVSVEPVVVEAPEIVVEDIIPEPIVIDIAPVESTDETEQKIQEDPVIPEVPSEPPVLKEGTDLTDPNTKPSYEETVMEEPAATPKPEEVKVESKPKDEGGHEGQIYVPGFGWIKDIGPGQVIDAPEIYLNGNKVGDM